MTTAIPRQSKIRRIALIHDVGLGIQAGQFLIFQTYTYLLFVVLGEARILWLPPLTPLAPLIKLIISHMFLYNFLGDGETGRRGDEGSHKSRFSSLHILIKSSREAKLLSLESFVKQGFQDCYKRCD